MSNIPGFEYRDENSSVDAEAHGRDAATPRPAAVCDVEEKETLGKYVH